jgi:hypothetical protein
MTIFLNIVNWLEKHQKPCFYKKYLGVDCPGCGMQRALIALLKGNFWGSLQIYPALIPILLLILILILHLIFKFKRGTLYIKILFVISVVLIVFNYIYNLI